MGTISQLPFSLSFPSFHYRKPLFYYHLHQQPQPFVSYLSSTKKRGFVCFACSIKQTRVRKKVKSNEELRSEILEFVTLAGLPEGHVPSMKELSSYGRVDLANIIRRRGYKFIRKLLANPDIEDYNELASAKNTDMETSASGIYLEGSLTEGQGEEAVDGNLSRLHSSPATDGSIPLDQRINNFPGEGVITNSSPDTEEHGSVCIDDSSMVGVPGMKNSLFNLGDTNHSGEITENNLKIECVELNNRADIESSPSESPISAKHDSSVPYRESENVLMTENEDINDVDKDFSLNYDHYATQDLNYIKHVDISTESFSAESFQNQQIDDMAENLPGSADASLVGSDGTDWMLRLSSSTSSIEEKTTRFIQNGYLDTVDDDRNDIPHEGCPEETKESGEYIGDSYGGQRSVSTPPNGSVLAFEEISHDALEVNSSGSGRDSDQRDGSGDLDNSNDETMREEYQVEITRLRFMLRQKEVELSRLKEQIEKEKLSLSVLQRQAETEIQKAQMVISEKDVELEEAEGSLSGLQEVEIEYSGDGNVVEVTGSFNGWQHRVGLELQASKSIGKQKRWSTLMWLYPGTYEIKFIVDGQWTTDPTKESVSKGHITNNILKVQT